MNWSPVNRPVTLDELAIAFDVTTAKLERLVATRRIAPAFLIGRIRAYGPTQVRRIYYLVRSQA